MGEDSGAPRACVRCKTRKKKCDKMLPSCERCTRLALECSYEEVQTSRGDGEGGDLNTMLGARLAALENMVSDLSQEVKDLRSKQNFVTGDLSPEAQWRQLVSGPLPEDQRIMEHTNAVLRNAKISFTDILETFFNTIHRRLPIFSKQLFLLEFRQLEAFNIEQELLKAVICLLVIYPGSLNMQEASVLFQKLYQSSKILFSLITSTPNHRLSAIQAGILLCYYEMTQGLLDQAHNSLGICLRSAHLAQQSHVLLSAQSDTGHESPRLPFEVDSVFWCLSLLQSYLNAMRHDMSANNPITSHLKAGETFQLDMTERVSLAVRDSPGGLLLSQHIQEIAAASLLDDVYSIVFSSRDFQSSQFRQALEIDYKLTRLITDIKGQPESPVVEQVVGGAYVTCLWALYKLHCFIYSKATELSDHGFFQVSYLSLRQLSSVSNTLAQSLNTGIGKGEIDMRVLPLTICCVLHNALVAEDVLRNRPSESPDDPVRSLLRLLGQNWALPEKYPGHA